MAQQQRRQPQQQPSQREHRPPRQRSADDRFDEVFGKAEAKVEVVSMDSVALESITKSEVMMQLDAAHKYPRKIPVFLENAIALCTMSEVTAKSCIYALPRYENGVQKDIKGPSIRLAEMAANNWRNLRLGSRIIDVAEKDITAQGISWDLETNNQVSVEVKRGIWSSPKGSDGRRGAGFRFSEDMIRVTQQAGISIALRNAIFRTIPKALIDVIYGAATDKATGRVDNTFNQKRDRAISWFVNDQGIDAERFFARLGISGPNAFEPEHLELCIGWANAIRDGETTIEAIFDLKPKQEQTAGTPRSTGAAVEEMAAKHKADKAARAAKSEPPPPANDTLTVNQVVDALVDADESWAQLTGAAARAIVEAWSPEHRRSAHVWAVAFSKTPDDLPPPEQPEHTFLPRERQPGEEG